MNWLEQKNKKDRQNRQNSFTLPTAAVAKNEMVAKNETFNDIE